MNTYARAAFALATLLSLVACDDLVTSNTEACEAAEIAANACEAELERPEGEWSQFDCEDHQSASLYHVSEWLCLEDAFLTADCSSEEGYGSTDVASCLGY